MADDFAPKTLDAFVAQSLAQAGSVRTWAVAKDGELCGMISFEPRSAVMGRAHIVFRKDFWGRDVTGEALRTVAADIFSTGIEKIAGVVFSDNRAILSAAAAIGAKREGTLRRHTLRGGKLVDLAVVGLLKEDFHRSCQLSAISYQLRTPPEVSHVVSERPIHHHDEVHVELHQDHPGRPAAARRHDGGIAGDGDPKPQR